MNGLDSFFGLDQPEGAISAEKVREYKARMQRNQKAMAAARQQEQRQKKKENNLAAILLRFIQTNQHADITLLVSRCLEENMPAVFLLAILILGNENLQKELGIQLEMDAPELNAPEIPDNTTEAIEEAVEAQEDLESLENPETKGALVLFGQKDHAFPLKMRMSVDLWGKNIWEAMSPIPERLFKTACVWKGDADAEPEPKALVIELTTLVLRNYFAANRFEASLEQLKHFSAFFMAGLFKRLKDQVNNQQQLNGEAADEPSGP